MGSQKCWNMYAAFRVLIRIADYYCRIAVICKNKAYICIKRQETI